MSNQTNVNILAFAASARLDSFNKKLVTLGAAPDGPFVEIKELVGGYMIVSAKTLDEAADVVNPDFDTITALIEGGDGDHLGEKDIINVRLSR